MFGLIVQKELREILTSPRFAATFGVVSLLILLAFFLGARSFNAEQERYEAAVQEQLRQLEGQTDWLSVVPTVNMPPQPLAALVNGIANDVGRSARVLAMGLLRATGSRYNEEPALAVFRFLDLEFIFLVVLSLFAILFAFDLISGEKERGTLRLAMSNAVPRDTFVLGKLTGALVALTLPLLIPLLLGSLLFVAMGVPMSGEDWLRLALIIVAGLLYVGAFLGISVLVSALTEKSSTSFLVVLVVWIIAVLVVPRGAVLLSARSVDVPTVDSVLSQQRRLRAQLMVEDQKAMQKFFAEQMDFSEGGDAQASIGRFNEFMAQQAEDRKAKLDELTARLEEERRNRQSAQQRVAFTLARLSPAAAYSLASMSLAGTALDLPRHFLDQVSAYQEGWGRFQKERTGSAGSGFRIIIATDEEREEPKAIDPRELPAFNYQPLSAATVFRQAALDLGLLALFNILFFTGAFVAFLRYDVR